jgi:hypothetical protein
LIGICVLAGLTLLSSCYSFKGVSITPDLQTFKVLEFGLLASNAPATLNQEFAESLRDKITNESRLNYVENEADIEFGGEITSFNVRSVAPQEGNTTALTRLEIRINVKFTNNIKEDDGWQKPFSFFWDFESSEDLLTVQDELIEIIFEKIVEDVFNAAFADW